MSFCTKCGKQNSEAAKFCVNCGAILSKPVNVSELKSSNDSATASTASSIGVSKGLSFKNKMILLAVLVIMAIVIAAYYLFIKADPNRDGKNVAASFCDCGKNQSNRLKETYKGYISDFASYKFSGSEAALKTLDSLIQSIAEISKNCYTSNQKKFEKLKLKYLNNDDERKTFESAYSEQLLLCNNNNSELVSLYNDAQGKATQYIGPIEKERLRQDSMGVIGRQLQLSTTQFGQDSINAANQQSQLSAKAKQDSLKQDKDRSVTTSLEYAEKNLPTAERMKQDIRGKTFKLPSNELGWANVHYDPDVNFLTFKSSENSFQKDARSFTSNIDMVTGDDKRIHCDLIGTISYVWDINNNAWNFGNIQVHEFKRARELQTATIANDQGKAANSNAAKTEGNRSSQLNEILFSSYRSGPVRNYTIGKADTFNDVKKGAAQPTNVIFMFINRDNEILYQDQLIQHIQNWIQNSVRLSTTNPQSIKIDSLFKVELWFSERFNPSVTGGKTFWYADLKTSITLTKNGKQVKDDSFTNSTTILLGNIDKWAALEGAIKKCEKKLGKILDDYMHLN